MRRLRRRAAADSCRVGLAGRPAAAGWTRSASDVQRATRTGVTEQDATAGWPARAAAARTARCALRSSATQAVAIRRRHEVAQQMVAWRREVSLRLRGHARRQHLPTPWPRTISCTKFEEPYHALLDARREVLRRHRQPRSATRAGLSKVQHGGAPLLHVQAQRAQHRRGSPAQASGSSSSTADRSIRISSRGCATSSRNRDRLEDLLFPSSALHVRPLHDRRACACGWRSSRFSIDGDVDVVLTGHEHFYERIHPQHGISYFMSGGAGSLRKETSGVPPRSWRAVSIPIFIS